MLIDLHLRFRAVAFLLFTLHLAGTADSGGLFAGALFRRLFKMTTQFHFAVHAFTLQLFLQRAEGLINIIVANHDLHKKTQLRYRIGKVT